jgi:hypothetical protein
LTLAAQARLHVLRARPFGNGRVAAGIGAAFVVLAVVGVYALQIGLRGSFDLSSVSHRDEFLAFTITLALVWSASGIGLHWGFRRDLDALVLDWCALSIVGTLLSVAHPLALGFVVGYPAPSADVHFFPYFAALVLGVVQPVGMILCGAAIVRDRRKGREDREPAPGRPDGNLGVRTRGT